MMVHHDDSMKRRILIVGGGLAGLACAIRLRDAGIEALLLERSDAVGGRVRTDMDQGFLLDRGFQVYLSAYPEAGKLLDLPALDLRRFKPGALVFKDGKLRRMMDAFRCPQYALSTAIQPIGTVRDKLRVGWLRLQAALASLGDIAAHEDRTTETYLRQFGFSESMIDGFFRPFYGGIFLERDLRTSSRMFEFTFKMFAGGYATLPAKGMQEIPRQLVERLPADAIRLNTVVRSVEAGAVTLESGERLTADAVVVATDAGMADRLVTGVRQNETGWRSTTGIYFAAPRSPLNEAIIALNGNPAGLVNNVCVPSDVSARYAPEGRALISVSLLGLPDFEDLERRVLNELETWFGPEVRTWQHLRTYRIPHALPEQPPGGSTPTGDGFRLHDGVYVCGDHCSSASIEGALISGRSVAENIIATNPRFLRDELEQVAPEHFHLED
jgi:phytoene dehydrogenase-like protein